MSFRVFPWSRLESDSARFLLSSWSHRLPQEASVAAGAREWRSSFWRCSEQVSFLSHCALQRWRLWAAIMICCNSVVGKETDLIARFARLVADAADLPPTKNVWKARMTCRDDRPTVFQKYQKWQSLALAQVLAARSTHDMSNSGWCFPSAFDPGCRLEIHWWLILQRKNLLCEY